MLGRFINISILIAVLLAGGFAIDFLSKEPGQITIDYGGRIHELTVFGAALVLVGGILALMLVLWLLRFLTAVLRWILYGEGFERRRERSGMDAVSKSLMALETGDAKTARKKAAVAQDKLPAKNAALTRLIKAKAAEMTGDEKDATTYYKALMSEPETAFVGTRGLLRQAVAADRTDRALKLAEKAHGLNPRDAETLETLYTLQSRKFDWAAARQTLSKQSRAGHVAKLEAARRESALIHAQAEDAEELGETEHARALAVEAAKLDPRNADAVSTAVRLLVDTGSKRAASKLVIDAWKAQPSAKLAAAYATIEPDESPAQRRRRFEGLFALHPENPETRYLRAELALVAEDWSGARAAIQDLRETEPSARSCAIMAAIARGEGEPDHIVRGWLARALGAPRDETTESEISHAAMLPLLIEPATPADEVAGDATPKDGPAADDAEETPDVPVEDATEADAGPTDDAPEETARKPETTA